MDHDDFEHHVVSKESNELNELKSTENFQFPSHVEMNEFIRQTAGIMTNEIRMHLQLTSLNVINNVQYNGNLSMKQQIFIIQELSDSSIYSMHTKISQTENEIDLNVDKYPMPLVYPDYQIINDNYQDI